MSDNETYGDDGFEDDCEDELPVAGVDNELLSAHAQVDAHQAAAAEQQKEASSQSRGGYDKWGTRGPSMKHGKRTDMISELIKEAGTKPGPGHYPARSYATAGRAAPFTKGRRIEEKIDDEEGTYLDPLHSTTLTKRGTVISPPRHGEYFTRWNEEEVGRWLDTVGLGHLSESFQSQKVQGADLWDITPEEQRDFLGVNVFADRKRLNKELKVGIGLFTL